MLIAAGSALSPAMNAAACAITTPPFESQRVALDAFLRPDEQLADLVP